MICGTSTTLQIDEVMPDVSGVPGPNMAATPSAISSQTVKSYVRMKITFFIK
jgi:hypothetical protein